MLLLSLAVRREITWYFHLLVWGTSRLTSFFLALFLSVFWCVGTLRALSRSSLLGIEEKGVAFLAYQTKVIEIRVCF